MQKLNAVQQHWRYTEPVQTKPLQERLIPNPAEPSCFHYELVMFQAHSTMGMFHVPVSL